MARSTPNPKRFAFLCKLVLIGFVLVWIACLALAFIGSQGLMGHPPDPFAAVFLILLGMPWALAVVPLTFLPIPTFISQTLLVLAPGITAYVIWSICKARAQK